MYTCIFKYIYIYTYIYISIYICICMYMYLNIFIGVPYIYMYLPRFHTERLIFVWGPQTAHCLLNVRWSDGAEFGAEYALIRPRCAEFLALERLGHDA